MEEFRQKLHNCIECEIQTKQEKEIMEKEMAYIKEKLMEAVEACESERAAKMKRKSY